MRHLFLQLFCLGALLLAAAGCRTTADAKWTVRPEWLRGESAVLPQPVKLAVDCTLSGNAASDDDRLAATQALGALVHSTLTRSGCYVIVGQGEAATLKLHFDIALDAAVIARNPSFELVRTPYIIARDPPEPRSLIDSRGVVHEKVTAPYEYPQLSCGGALTAVYTDSQGQVRWQQHTPVAVRVYDFDQQTAGAGLMPLPTHLGALLEVFYPALTAALSAVTPTQYTQPLQLNPNGSPALRMLIQAGAYREALMLLQHSPALSEPDRENAKVLKRLVGEE